MNIEKVIDNLELKFTSGNSVPIDRAAITREEWEAIKEFLFHDCQMFLCDKCNHFVTKMLNE